MYSKTGAHLGLREDRALAANLAWHLNQWLTQVQAPRLAAHAPARDVVRGLVNQDTVVRDPVYRDPIIRDAVYRDPIIQEGSVASRAAG